MQPYHHSHRLRRPAVPVQAHELLAHLPKRDEPPVPHVHEDRSRVDIDLDPITVCERLGEDAVRRTQADLRGPVPLPTEKHRYTVIRGPFKDKDSREHFEMRIHKRLLDILNPSPKTVDSLQRLDLPAGIDIEIKIQQN